MKKIILAYGAMTGALSISNAIMFTVLSRYEAVRSMEWLGFLVTIVALSILFIGIKRYRDRELGGVIKFETAFTFGLGMAVVAGITYVVGWEVYLFATDYTFMENYTAGIVKASEAAGVTGIDLEQKITEMEAMKVRYANPFIRMPMTFFEIFPIALIIVLGSAAALRNSNFLPARG